MRVLVAGASGFLGSALRERLTAEGHEVEQLVRREPQDEHEHSWDPAERRLDTDLVTGMDAVVNLGGSSLVGNPHSSTYRQRLRQSRIDTTATVADAVAAAAQGSRPAMIAASGIAWYGDHGDEEVTEQTGTRGDAFMSGVARDWERATSAAGRAGARVVMLRTPPVIDRRSGALKAMLTPFKLGLGGPLGNGRQYFPIVSTADWVSAVVFALTDDRIEGPVNPVIPAPTTNAEFTETLGDLLRRPTVLRVPAFVLDKAAGPLSPELLGSVRALPQVLQDAGFTFAHPDVRSVLVAALAA